MIPRAVNSKSWLFIAWCIIFQHVTSSTICNIAMAQKNADADALRGRSVPSNTFEARALLLRLAKPNRLLLTT